MDRNCTEGDKHGFKRTMKEMLGAEESEHGSKHTMKKMFGKVSDNRKEVTGTIEKMVGNAQKKVGRTPDDTHDTARMDGDLDDLPSARRGPQ